RSRGGRPCGRQPRRARAVAGRLARARTGAPSRRWFADAVCGGGATKELAERFARFFRAVNDGADPYPWQVDLLVSLLTEGRWPTASVAPTGAGKSSVVDVHVFAVAERARRVAAGDGDSTR